MSKHIKLPRYVLAIGNAFGGLSLVGIWVDPEECTEYAEKYHRHDEWNMVPLHEREDVNYEN